MVRAEKKVAIVTGASSGMGLALSTSLVSHNYLVALVDVSPPPSSLLGRNTKYFSTDVSSYASQAAMFTAVWDTWGRIDALCANAGIVDRGSLFILNWRGKEEVPPEPDLSCTDVDWKGVVYGTVLATHFMRRNGGSGGKIVCTASIAGVFPHKSYPEYNGAKAAVVNFVRSTAPVLKIKDNITINAICPGIVATSIIPPEMIAAVSPECLTPISTIIRAYHLFLDDEPPTSSILNTSQPIPTILNGQILEASTDKLFFLEEPKEANGRFTRRSVTVWDPLFRLLHGEESELPEAIP